MVMAATRGAGSMRPTVVVENIGRLGLQAVARCWSPTSPEVARWRSPWPGRCPTCWAWPSAGAWLHRLVVTRTAATSGARPRRGARSPASSGPTPRPRAIARVTQTALKRSDIVLVAALASPADAALYTAATRFIVLGQLFVQSVQQALSPHLSALFARARPGRGQLGLPGRHALEHDRRLAALPGRWRASPHADGRVRRRVRRRLRRRADPVADHAAGHGVRPRRLGAAHGRPELAQPAQQHRGPGRQRRPQLRCSSRSTASGAPRSPGPSPSSCATCCPSSRSADTWRCGRSPRPPSGWPSVRSSASASWTSSSRSRTSRPRRRRRCSPWPLAVYLFGVWSWRAHAGARRVPLGAARRRRSGAGQLHRI